MRSLAGLALSLLVVGSALQAGIGVSAATTGSLDRCQTIDSSGTYTLTEDLTDFGSQSHPNARDSCIVITARGVTFDGANHVISLHDTAVRVEVDDVTVENVVVELGSGKPRTGIQYDHAADGVIRNNEIRDVTTGIDVVGGQRHLVEGNTVERSSGDGIRIRSQSRNNEVRDNTVRGSHHNGIVVETGAIETEIRNNEFESNDRDGVEVRTDDNTVANNHVGGNQHSGISVVTGFDNEVTDNVVVDNSKHGIELDGATENVVSGNEVRSNSDAGIYLYGSDGNEIGDKNVVESNYDGIELVSSTKNEIHNNTVTNNLANGTYVASASHFNGFFHNDVEDNQDYGIAIENSGGNDFIDVSAVDNGKAAFYAGGSGVNHASALTIGSSGNAITVAFHNTGGVVIDTTTKPPDGPNPNEVGDDSTDDSGNSGISDSLDTPNPVLDPDVQTALTDAERDLVEIMNVSEKAQIRKYVRVRPAKETPQGTSAGANMDSLKIYYEDADLNCNYETDLQVWRFSAGEDPQESGAWRPNVGEDERGYTTETIDPQRFDPVHLESQKYVGLVNHSDTDTSLVSFRFVDYHVFAAMSDKRPTCTPTPYTQPTEDESTPGFGVGISLVAIVAVLSRRLLDR